jgi:hypothetical protein
MRDIQGRMSMARFIAGLAVLAWTLTMAAPAWPQELQQMRDDVAGAGQGQSSGESSSHDHEHHHHDGVRQAQDPTVEDGDLYMGALFVAGAAVTSPWWLPHWAAGDQFDVPGYFPQFPYQPGPGYMIIGSLDAKLDSNCPEDLRRLLTSSNDRRTWAGRFDLEYANEFDNLSRMGGHLLVSTTSRFELDLEASRFEEHLFSGETDHLWIGDANLSYRFAQNEYVQFRSGLGMNWMADGRADVGFNFTYGADFFPARPWVISANLDWGTLGHAELFRFRTTVGAIVNRFEVYTGYEYFDLGNTQANSLLAGIRLWF